MYMKNDVEAASRMEYVPVLWLFLIRARPSACRVSVLCDRQCVVVEKLDKGVCVCVFGWT